jgi:predicted AlkP superfamily pyrophosphatase or phosphodiesterase
MEAVRWVTLLVLVVLASGAPVRAATPHVYLVVVDGLGAGALDATLMPRLSDPTLTSPGVRTEARAVMPTRTNPNHATLLSGVFPESHGITGNGWWDPAAHASASLDAAALLDAETLFTVAETTRPELVTVAAFSKAKLGRLFAGVPDRQRAPDVLWVPATEGASGHLLGLATDAETMDAFLAATVDREPDLAAINLSEVDRAAHEQGPAATADARRHADAAIGRLIDDLRARGRWARAVVMVTADHGFDDVAPTPDRPDRVVTLEGDFAAAGLATAHVIADGGVAHVVVEDHDPATIGWAAALAWRHAGVAEILARRSVPNVATLATAHPDWHLDHDRTGDLLLVAEPGYQFAEAQDDVARTFRGNHGSPREIPIPLVITGGALATNPKLDHPTSADIGATIGALLALRPVHRLDGQPVRAGKPFPLPLRAQF